MHNTEKTHSKRDETIVFTSIKTVTLDGQTPLGEIPFLLKYNNILYVVACVYTTTLNLDFCVITGNLGVMGLLKVQSVYLGMIHFCKPVG